jgi:hypothetical protein
MKPEIRAQDYDVSDREIKNIVFPDRLSFSAATMLPHSLVLIARLADEVHHV